MPIVFWDFLMFEQIFFSPQSEMKQKLLIINMVYKLPHEFPNDLRKKY